MPPFGPMSPDLPQHGHDGLVLARNCYAGVLGYEPIKAPTAITSALPATWKGGGAFQGTGGNTALLAAAAAGLYTLTSSAATLVHAVATTTQWFFAQFGDLVIGTHGGAPVKFTLTAGTGAALGGSPPSASMVAVARDFVGLAGNSAATTTFYWSAINNAEGWTVGSNQADIQVIPDDGPITGIAGGDFFTVFQGTAISVFEYVGSPIVFSYRKVVRGIGAVCQGTIGQHGRQTFFYSRRGFYKFVDGEVVPIGRNRVDRTFRTTYSMSEIEANIRCTVDPERSLVIWSMPDRLWIYNFDNERWSEVYVPGIVGISNGATASVTLETIAVTYPSIEDVPGSLDDPVWRGGEPMLLIAKTDNILYSFGSSSNLEATFRLPKLEQYPGRETHVYNTRLVGDPVSATVAIDCQARMGDVAVNVTSTDLKANGDVPIRASGRYLQPTITLGAGTVWTSIQGFDMETTPGGRQ